LSIRLGINFYTSHLSGNLNNVILKFESSSFCCWK